LYENIKKRYCELGFVLQQQNGGGLGSMYKRRWLLFCYWDLFVCLFFCIFICQCIYLLENSIM